MDALALGMQALRISMVLEDNPSMSGLDLDRLREGHALLRRSIAGAKFELRGGTEGLEPQAIEEAPYVDKTLQALQIGQGQTVAQEHLERLGKVLRSLIEKRSKPNRDELDELRRFFEHLSKELLTEVKNRPPIREDLDDEQDAFSLF